MNYMGIARVRVSDAFLDQVVSVLRGSSREELENGNGLSETAASEVSSGDQKTARRAARSYLIANFPELGHG